MNVTVIGDLLLDVDIEGDVERLAPYAPVPVLDVVSETKRAGGAGLVATLLHRDGDTVTLVTALGDDARAAELPPLLAGVTLVTGRSPSPTVVKTRIRSREQPVVRIDEGSGRPEAPIVTPEMLAAVATADLVVVADYGRRLLDDPALREAVAEAATRVPVVWDPHARGSQPVPGVVVTPNMAEARVFSAVEGGGVPFADEAALRLLTTWRVAAVVVTMGGLGALLRRSADGLPLIASGPLVQEADVNGAGDRFASALAVALGHGRELGDAVQAAVLETGRFLSDGGVATLTDVTPPAVTSREHDALAVVERVRAAGGTVVATGGVFDLIHAGHARTLSAARALGDCLIVLLNSDESVQRLKGPERPLMSADDRVDLLLALEVVDGVIVFGEDTPSDAIRRVRPDLWVKGGDYAAADLPEAAVLGEWGGRAVTVPFFPGRSTTRLAEAIAKVS
ncbi:MAG: bifunctional heptose 7-phosphate kinase/heptose 1-phosphate adenyltransferase [Acidobacteria bacterium]|nr:bifunctional heptose 7-phosphate kinase/heptose 1-phosphate adenyltransferase [Acidobacteriota bacterium]